MATCHKCGAELPLTGTICPSCWAERPEELVGGCGCLLALGGVYLVQDYELHTNVWFWLVVAACVCLLRWVVRKLNSPM